MTGDVISVPRGEAGERTAWDDVYTRAETADRMLRWVTTHVPLVTALYGLDRVLEVGTGTGMLSAFLARSGISTATLDISTPVLDVAGRFYADVGASVGRVAGDAFAMPFGDDSFDAVFSQGLLEHFTDAAIDEIVREQLRVAPLVLASVPTAFYPHVGRRGPGLVGNERLMTKRRWVRILADHRVEPRYYPDWKVATFGGVTLPVPSQLLITVRR